MFLINKIVCRASVKVIVKFVVIGWLMFGNLEEDFFSNLQTKSFCVKKEPFILLNEKIKAQIFEQI